MSLKSSECRRTIHFLFCVCSSPFLVQLFIFGTAMQVDLNCAFEAKPRQDFVGLDCVGNLNQFHLGVFLQFRTTCVSVITFKPFWKSIDFLFGEIMNWRNGFDSEIFREGNWGALGTAEWHLSLACLIVIFFL